MLGRKYSVSEIERMREAVESIVIWGHGNRVFLGGGRSSKVFHGDELEIKVRERLLTYIQIGMGPDELENFRPRTATE